MDLSSILTMTATIIKALNDYSTSVKGAPRSCEAFKVELSSTQRLLEELEHLVEEGHGDVRVLCIWLTSPYWTCIWLGCFDSAINRRWKSVKETSNYLDRYFGVASYPAAKLLENVALSEVVVVLVNATKENWKVLIWVGEVQVGCYVGSQYWFEVCTLRRLTLVY